MYLVTYGSTLRSSRLDQQLLGLGSRDPATVVGELSAKHPASVSAVIFADDLTELRCAVGRKGRAHTMSLFKRRVVAVRESAAALRPLFREGVAVRSYEFEASKAAGVVVPVLWRDVASLARAMDALSTMVVSEALVSACTRERRLAVTLRPGELKLEAVPWTGEPEVDAVLPPVSAGLDAAGFRRASFSKPKRSRHRPFTTGDAKARLKEIPDRADETNQTALLEALIDPANAGPYYEGVRRRLYSAISWLDVADVHAAFRHALRIESDDVAHSLAQLAWRLKPVLAQWAREDLVRAWTEDRRLARRILYALDEAYFEIPAEWVADAPADLRAVLARPAGHRAIAVVS